MNKSVATLKKAFKDLGDLNEIQQNHKNLILQGELSEKLCEIL